MNRSMSFAVAPRQPLEYWTMCRDEIHEYLTDIGYTVPDQASYSALWELCRMAEEDAWIRDNDWMAGE
jgi:hypothetical protein